MPPPSTMLQATGSRDLARPLTGLFALGAIAVGVSGLVAEAMGGVWGAGFVSGDGPGTTYTAERCAEFEEYFPGDGCLTAAAEHHWGEVVQYRVVMGVLGLLALAVYVALRRAAARPGEDPEVDEGSSGGGGGTGRTGRRRPLPGWVAPAAATGLFGAAALGLGAQSWVAAASGGQGVGAPLSGAVVSAAGALACGAAAVLAYRRERWAGTD